MNPLLTWAELTPKQREAAVEHEVNSLLALTLDGTIRWSDPGFEQAFAEMDRMSTPWFAGERIMELCGDLLRQVASSHVQAMLYFNPHSEAVVSDCSLPKE